MRNLKKFLIPAVALSVALTTFNVAEASTMDSKEVLVTLDDKTKAVNTNATTVAGLLNNFDYAYKPADQLNHKLTDVVSEDMNVVINTEKKVTVILKGKEKKVVTKSNTVEDLLKELKIELSKDDSVIPSLDSTLKNDDKIMLIYTRNKNQVVKEKVANKTVKEFSFDIPYGEKKVENKGSNGLLEKKYKQVIKNDILVSEELTSKVLVKKPVEKKILIGTKEVVNKKLDNSVIKRKTNNLYKGETRIIEEGNKGTERTIYKNDGKNRKLISKKIVVEPKDKIVEVGTKKRPVAENRSSSQDNYESSSSSSSPTKSTAKYTLSEFMFNGVVNWGGHKFTYYSQSVLPGGGLSIPGRHVNDAGYVSDGNGYIVVAANRSVSKGTIINTPFGAQGKVYDICAGCTPDWIDVYIK